MIGAAVGGVVVPGAVLAAALAAVAACLALRGGPGRSAARRVRGGPLAPAGAEGQRGHPRDEDLLGRHRVLASLLSGLAPALFLGGPVGVLAGALVAVAVHRRLRRREPARQRRRREQLVRDLPQVVDLLAVALAAGAAPSTALGVVAAAVEGPAADELVAVRRSMFLGRDPVRVWRELAERPGLAALGRTMARATETGASVADALHRLAEDLQGAARTEAESRARTVGVRAAAPLGLCLLPGFVLVGIVPVVAGTVSSLLSR
jgi:Flp pilus assembly protein TadB